MTISDQAQSAKKPIEDDPVKDSTAASAPATDQVPAKQKLSMLAYEDASGSLNKKCAGCAYTKTVWDFFEDERKKGADAVCLPSKLNFDASCGPGQLLTGQQKCRTCTAPDWEAPAPVTNSTNWVSTEYPALSQIDDGRVGKMAKAFKREWADGTPLEDSPFDRV